jgi:hypothetical protein
MYLPTGYLLIAPFALLPYGTALVIWLILLAGVFFLAAFLMWDIGRSYAPGVSLFLICIVLANSEVLFAGGNPAGIAVSLCVVAVWCFLRERFVPAGILCMAVSLAIKPHDAGLVWLYFLLAGGVYRKRALQTLAVTVLLALPAVLWMSHIAPHWIAGLAIQSVGYVCARRHHRSRTRFNARFPRPRHDHRPANGHKRLPGRSADLQSGQLSGMRRSPARVVGYHSQVAPFAKAKTWLALAAVVPLTMLVTYHRPYDAKLLLLAVPACAIAVGRGRPDWMDCTYGEYRCACVDGRYPVDHPLDSHQEPAPCPQQRCPGRSYGCACTASAAHPAGHGHISIYGCISGAPSREETQGILLNFMLVAK